MKYRLWAKFADGHKAKMDKEDKSAFSEGHNFFYDVLHELPKAHGPVIKLALKRGPVSKAESVVPLGATPVYEIDRNRSLNVDTGEQKQWDSAFRIGYELHGERKLIELKG